jgi:hypothetical protein
MENWKRALLAGSAGASVIMFLKGKSLAGMMLGGVALITLAMEYPDEFEAFRQRLPEYVERGTGYIDMIGRVSERLAQATEGRTANLLEALLSR